VDENMTVKVCFIGGARYNQPLDTSNAKKFRALTSLGKIFVIGFSPKLSLRRFREHAYFYLLPQFPMAFVRYAEIFLLGLPLACWLISRQGVQVLVAQSPYEGLPAVLAKKITGWLGYRVAVVVESHGDFQESLFLYRRVPLQRLYRFLMRRIASFVLTHTDVLRAISKSSKEQFERLRPTTPIFQFPAWSDIEAFLKISVNDARPPCPNILYAGVLSPVKGVHHLINAFALVAKDFLRARLLIAGREQNRTYAAGLRKQVRGLRLNGRIRFSGAMPQAELALQMRNACVLVLPSASEGLGRVLLEAMATGIPVIGSGVGGIPELVEEGVNGFLVPPGDEKALAEKIRWMLENPEQAHAMGCHGRAFVEGFFSTEAYVKAYRQIFEVAELLVSGTEHAPLTL